jgi:hypothetical protein
MGVLAKLKTGLHPRAGLWTISRSQDILLRMGHLCRDPAKGYDYQRYTLRSSVACVIRLHIGQSFVALRQRNQHALQHVCQQPVDTVGSV